MSKVLKLEGFEKRLATGALLESVRVKAILYGSSRGIWLQATLIGHVHIKVRFDSLSDAAEAFNRIHKQGAKNRK